MVQRIGNGGLNQGVTTETSDCIWILDIFQRQNQQDLLNWMLGLREWENSKTAPMYPALYVDKCLISLQYDTNWFLVTVLMLKSAAGTRDKC